MSPRIISTHRRILVVDAQASTHATFRGLFESSSSLDAPTCSPHIGSGDEHEFQSTGERPGLRFSLGHAHSGEQALQMVSEAVAKGAHFEVAFVDSQLPGMCGIETIQRLWKLDADLQIVCTSGGDLSLSSVIERLGICDRLLLLKKPLGDDELLQLGRALSQKRQLLNQNRLQLETLEAANRLLQTEVGQRRSAEHRLQHAATHDGLTGLPNREFIRSAIANHVVATTNAPQAALLFLDVDNFKFINDSLGHHAGDELLVQIAARLCGVHRYRKGGTQGSSTIARLGGDEFVLFLTDLNDTQDAVRLAETLQQDLTAGYTLSGHEVSIGVSIGIAFLNDAIHAPEQLMRNADLAMYRAKFSGKHCMAVYDDAMHKLASRRLELESALRGAIKSGELSLRHQPIVNIQSGKLVGFESLLRWTLPQGEVVSPDEFIPLAEETGQIVSIGRWVLEQACQTIQSINGQRPPSERISISVNVTKRQILDASFVSDVQAILASNDLDGNLLNLEITESVVMTSPDLIVDRLNALKQLGIKIHMDDFGTGHSSLSCLHRFPIDVLKIDRSFVSTMESNPDYESIIHAIITLAHNLNTAVIAEGIETTEQLERLKNLTCDFGQGYLFSVPLLASELHDRAGALLVAPLDAPLCFMDTPSHPIR